ncbi:MAG: hypothetical protein K1X65_17515 [Caldilineales bacterium]|nr:hypothetical protein [Caldilineales bacterium]MCW5859327.1 hypothetical protein [Caldilineales bacterium]
MNDLISERLAPNLVGDLTNGAVQPQIARLALQVDVSTPRALSWLMAQA